MVKLIMHGCNGHMGQVISDLVKQDPDAEIVAGIDIVDNRDNGYPVFTNIWDCHVEADALRSTLLPQRQWTTCWITVWTESFRPYCVRRAFPQNSSIRSARPAEKWPY